MQPYIAQTYLLLDIAGRIWNAISLTISQVGNDIQVYELRNKIHDTK